MIGIASETVNVIVIVNAIEIENGTVIVGIETVNEDAMRKRQPPTTTMPMILNDHLLPLTRLAVPTTPLLRLHQLRLQQMLPLILPDSHSILTLQLPT